MNDLDRIVAEICALDSELAKNPALVHQIVLELQRSAPAVVIDGAFRTRLRSELLRTHRAPAPSQKLPWWLLYGAPLSVTVLLLMLVRPTFAPVSQTIPEAAPEVPADTMMKMGAVMTEEAYSTERAADAVGGESAASPATDYLTAALTADSTVVTITYLSLQTPGFIVVNDAAGARIAVSALFAPGEYINDTFTARAPFVAGVLYTATLYYDDGDGVYTEGVDALATDASGVPIAFPLMAL